MISRSTFFKFAMQLFVLLALMGALALASIPTYAAVVQPDLQSAINFSVLAGTTITNTGNTVIGPPAPAPVLSGDIGVHPGSAITGFTLSPLPGPGVVLLPGVFHLADAVALEAKRDLRQAYNTLAGETPCTLLATPVGNLVLTPGIYCFTSAALLTGGTLTLDHLGNPDSLFVFKVRSQLTTGSGYTVAAINTGAGGACNVWWQVASSATLDTNTTFIGNIIALTSISLNTGASISPGRALARNGAVTLDNNSINMGACNTLAATSTPRATNTPVPTNTPTPAPTNTPSPTPLALPSSVTTLPLTGERPDYRVPALLLAGVFVLITGTWLFWRQKPKKS